VLRLRGGVGKGACAPAVGAMWGRKGFEVVRGDEAERLMPFSSRRDLIAFVRATGDPD
jgi:hypothetical protein